MYIDGEWEAGPANASFAVFNPATGAVISTVPDGGAELARAALDAAADAFPTWRATTPYERAAILMRAHALFLERQEQIARVMTEEQGKPLRAAMT